VPATLAAGTGSLASAAPIGKDLAHSPTAPGALSQGSSMPPPAEDTGVSDDAAADTGIHGTCSLVSNGDLASHAKESPANSEGGRCPQHVAATPFVTGSGAGKAAAGDAANAAAAAAVVFFLLYESVTTFV